MFSAFHQRRHGIGCFPGSDGHHAVTDGRTNPTDKSRHSEHLNRDLPGTLADLVPLFVRAGFQPGDAESSGSGGVPARSASGDPEPKGADGLGLNYHIQSRMRTCDGSGSVISSTGAPVAILKPLIFPARHSIFECALPPR